MASSLPRAHREMSEHPRDEMRDYTGSDLLAGKRALITGGDSGIGRAVAVAFAKEGPTWRSPISRKPRTPPTPSR